MGEQVHLAWQALGCLEHGFDGGRLQQWQLGAGQAQEMYQVRSDLVAVEAGNVVADDDSLGERLVGRHAQAPTQLGLANEKQAETILGVHLVIGEQAQIFEYLGA